jgi:methylglyoxal synthase
MEPGSVVTLDHIYRAIVEVKVVTDSMDARLRVLNGTVRQHEMDLAVLKDWRTTQANGAIHQVTDLRVELARAGAWGGGLGIAATIAAAVLKAFGVF